MADRAAVGEHEALQGRADADGLRHRPLRDADHADHRRRVGGGDPLLRPALRGGRVRDLGRVPDRRPRPGAAPHDRHGGAHRRPPRPRARGIQQGGKRTGDHRGVTLDDGGASPNRSAASPGGEPDASDGVDSQARNVPLDAHLHTDQSPDSSVPIDVYAAQAVERGIPEIAITDHVDFDPRDAAYESTGFEDRQRVVRDAAERWAARGVVIRFGAELTYNRRWESDVREHLARYRYDYVIGSVHDWPESPYWPGRIRAWVEGRSIDEIVAPYYDQIIGAAQSGLFDTIGHLDVVKRYLHPHITAADLAARPDLQEPALRAIVEAGVSLEVNSSGLRYPGAETYPAGPVVARYRELGGERVTVGSDAHARGSFAHRLGVSYDHVREAGFGELTLRRGSDRAAIEVPGGTRGRAAGAGRA